jgi:hypothetical protein
VPLLNRYRGENKAISVIGERLALALCLPPPQLSVRCQTYSRAKSPCFACALSRVQPSMTAINAAILMVAKLENVSEMAYGKTIWSW